MEQGRREMKPPPVQPSDDQQQNHPPPPPQKCPRCDSFSTKFCYYNNYSLSQPRYFCKNCRRYWTHGGTLRNVPIGGGCRKPKRVKISSTAIGDSSRSDQLFQPSGVAINYSNGGFSSMNSFAQPQPLFNVGSSSSNFSLLPGFDYQQPPNQQQMEYYQIGNRGMVEPNRLLSFLNQALMNSNNNNHRSNPNQNAGTSLNFLPEFPGYDSAPSS